MMVGTETRYARSGKLHVAYRTFGDGPIDVVLLPNWATNVESLRDIPRLHDFILGITRFARLIVFDYPGTGCSDPVALDALPSLEQWMDTTRVVMDAVGSDRAALFAQDSGFLNGALFAATYPQRTSALVANGAWARLLRGDGYDIGHSKESLDASKRSWILMWGTGAWQRVVSPNAIRTEEDRAAFARHERLSVPPGTLRVLIDLMFAADVRHVLPVISCPTLILHSEHDPAVQLRHGRYLAEHIKGARLHVIPGEDHYAYFLQPSVLNDAIEPFIVGANSAIAPDQHRILSTVLFTDIVGSTPRAAAVGDARWRDILAEHDRLTRDLIRTYDGREIKTTGDGFLAIFDGPARAIRCARELSNAVRALGIEIRAGLHTGECELRGDDVAGLAVSIAARVQTAAGPGEVLVSSTVKDLVIGSGLEFDDRGARELKGVPGDWRLFAVLA